MAARRLKKTRNAAGMGALELAISSILIVIVTLVCLDLSMVMLGNATLDRAARDACRAAAQQGTLTDAQKAANAALTAHKTDGYWITQPRLTSQGQPDFVYQDFGGDPLAGNPTVTVTTGCTVRLPVSPHVFGQQLVSVGSGGPGTIDFRRQYTYPIVKFKLGDDFN